MQVRAFLSWLFEALTKNRHVFRGERRRKATMVIVLLYLGAIAFFLGNNLYTLSFTHVQDTAEISFKLGILNAAVLIICAVAPETPAFKILKYGTACALVVIISTLVAVALRGAFPIMAIIAPWLPMGLGPVGILLMVRWLSKTEPKDFFPEGKNVGRSGRKRNAK